MTYDVSVDLTDDSQLFDIQIASTHRIRIAYLGKILKEQEALLAQGWKEGHVVNALVTIRQPSST
jgi:hypothetical protein